MNGFLIPALYGLAGISAYAALHHALIAWRSPVDRAHLLFAVLCASAAAYVVAKAGAYQADTAQGLVDLRRWELSFGVVFFIFFPWFVRAYTGYGPRGLLAGLSLLLTVVLTANLMLPYGISFMEFPKLAHLTLPWGEQVADLRVHRRGGWHNAAWAGFLLAFGHSLYACRQQYRRGERHQALMLAMGTLLFIVFALTNQLVNRSVIEFTHTAEFGFLSLIIVMNQALAREYRASERRMQAVLDHVPAVVYLKDLQGRYLLINRQFEKLFRLSNAAVATRTDYDLFPAVQSEALRSNDRRVLESLKPYQFEETVDIDGDARRFQTLKFPILYPNGEPYALCGISTDMTESHRSAQETDLLRQRVLHADRVARISALSTSLAHELSQPLTAMLSNAQAGLRFLEQDVPPLDEFRDILKDIVRDDERAIAIIVGLRAMLRQKKNARERIGLADAVTEALDLIQDEISRRGVRCERDLQPNCHVLADKVQIEQVVLNLVMNALDALNTRPADQRRLRVAVTSDGDGQARLAVNDSGMGLSPGEADRIFESFYSTKSQGLGMGLALCRSIIESHSGRIWANDNSDQGVTVQFILPMAREEQT